MPDCFKWNKFSSEKFKNALHDKEISQKIKYFMDNKFDAQETDINDAYSMFEGIILDIANVCLTRKTSMKSKSESVSELWFNVPPTRRSYGDGTLV